MSQVLSQVSEKNNLMIIILLMCLLSQKLFHSLSCLKYLKSSVPLLWISPKARGRQCLKDYKDRTRVYYILQQEAVRRGALIIPISRINVAEVLQVG